jgi:hypothetical protein
MDRDLIKIAIPLLKGSCIKGIQGSLGGDGGSNSDIDGEANRDINSFIIPTTNWPA